MGKRLREIIGSEKAERDLIHDRYGIYKGAGFGKPVILLYKFTMYCM